MQNAEPSALLLVDIGTLFTHVALVDTVAGDYRLVARADAFSTLELPNNDPWLGILNAIREIEQVTARSISRDDAPLMPQRPDGSGVDAMVITSSAAGTLPLVTVAIAHDTTGASLRRVAQASYTCILNMVTLDERPVLDRGADESWIDYQLDSLANLPIATVLMAGGIDGGTVAPIERMAHMLSFTVLRPSQQVNREYAHVIFAGNQNAVPAVEEALANTASMTTTANVRPTLHEEVLMPARLELMRFYTDRVLTQLPNYDRLRALSSVPLHTTSDGYCAFTRFIAKRQEWNVLIVDIGSMTTAAYASDGQRLAIAVNTNCGTAYGIAGVLDQAGIDKIRRWLPFEISEQQLREHILNNLLRPQIVPITHADLQIEQAVAREALRLTLDQLNDEQPTIPADIVIATGGVLTHVAHPAEALLMLLDVLPLNPNGTVRDIYLDREQVLGLCAGAAWHYPDVAFCLLDQDILRDGAFASCVTVQGTGTAGETAVEVELIPVGGTAQTIRVPHGEIRRIPFGLGKRATLRLVPSKNAWIGNNKHGDEVQSDVAGIHGSLLGLVIDARSTITPDEASLPAQRQAWLQQLQEGLTYTAQPMAIVEPEPVIVEDFSEPQPTEPETSDVEELHSVSEMPDQPEADQLKPEDFGITPVPDWLTAEDEPTDTVVDLGEKNKPLDVGEDIDNLRRELSEQAPAKKGFFRRR